MIKSSSHKSITFFTGEIDKWSNYKLEVKRNECENGDIQWFKSGYGLGASVPYWQKVDNTILEEKYKMYLRENKLKRIINGLHKEK